MVYLKPPVSKYSRTGCLLGGLFVLCPVGKGSKMSMPVVKATAGSDLFGPCMGDY